MKRLYFISITVLALASIVLMFLELGGVISLTEAPFKQVDAAIILIFTVDYIARFCMAKERKKFFKENIFDLIAIIPFNSLFAAFRAFRIFRIAKLTKLSKLMRFIRLTAFLGVIKKKTADILRTNGFLYVLYANVVLVLLSSIIMVFVEKMPFGDALWWSVVTVTTVGYGDFSPSSVVGRVIAVILMLFGIGLIGMLTGAITTYFTSRKVPEDDASKQQLQDIIESMDQDQKEKLLQIARIIIK